MLNDVVDGFNHLNKTKWLFERKSAINMSVMTSPLKGTQNYISPSAANNYIYLC